MATAESSSASKVRTNSLPGTMVASHGSSAKVPQLENTRESGGVSSPPTNVPWLVSVGSTSESKACQ